MQVNRDAFRRKLPMIMLRLIGRALERDVTVSIIEDDISETLKVSFRRDTGEPATIDMATSSAADLDEVEFLIENGASESDQET